MTEEIEEEEASEEEIEEEEAEEETEEVSGEEIEEAEEVHLEAVEAEEEGQEVQRYSSSLINMMESTLLKGQEQISFVLRTLFLESRSIIRRESVLMEKMERRLNIEFGIHTDLRLLLLFLVE